jgi:hypothetical protein
MYGRYEEMWAIESLVEKVSVGWRKKEGMKGGRRGALRELDSRNDGCGADYCRTAAAAEI